MHLYHGKFSMTSFTGTNSYITHNRRGEVSYCATLTEMSSRKLLFNNMLIIYSSTHSAIISTQNNVNLLAIYSYNCMSNRISQILAKGAFMNTIIQMRPDQFRNAPALSAQVRMVPVIEYELLNDYNIVRCLNFKND